MHKFNLLPFAILSALISLSFNASADISTDRAVISNNGSEQVTARVRFQTPVNGDLYIAVQVNGELLFLADEGANFTTAITPFRSNSHFSGSIDALNISGLGIAPGRYLLYQVVTEPGSDPLNFTNWMGGLGGLSTINFSIGLPVNLTGDFDNNGFPDDDNNHDGYHDDDSNHNGFHDDDQNHDGFHDDDVNRDGLHDDDSNHDGFHDDDQNHDGFHDDDVNRDGLHDDQENERVNDHGKHVNDSND